jgi:hypothetical protein
VQNHVQKKPNDSIAEEHRSEVGVQLHSGSKLVKASPLSGPEDHVQRVFKHSLIPAFTVRQRVAHAAHEKLEELGKGLRVPETKKQGPGHQKKQPWPIPDHKHKDRRNCAQARPGNTHDHKDQAQTIKDGLV